jgi:hypothetical protein
MAVTTCNKAVKLMRWYDTHDILCSKLCVRTPESGLRGVFAEEDIAMYEGIAVIPPHMIIQSPFKDMEEIVQANTLNEFANDCRQYGCDLSDLLQERGQYLDQPTKERLIAAIRGIPGIIARKCPLAIRLLELLHTQPEIWMPYKELCLPDRVPTAITMTSDELRDLLSQVPISAADLAREEHGQRYTREVFAECFEVLTQLLPLVLPTVDDVDPAEITWAFTIVQTRSRLTDEDNLRGFGPGHLVPLFDMMNHAVGDTCSFVLRPQIALPGMRAHRAVEADPARLSVVAGPDGAELLMRGGRPLGRLDDCLIVTAPMGGLRAGEEARFEYHDTRKLGPEERLQFLSTYGFYPE